MFKKIIKQIIDYAIDSRLRRETDLESRFRRIATDTTIDYINENMRDVIYLKTTWTGLADYIIPKINQNGSILEFGVWKGRSINHLAKRLHDKVIHGFDSFEGLPEDWKGHTNPKHTFSLEGKPPKVRKNVVLHKGWFDNTIPNFLEENKEDIALLNIDCDIYSSTHTIFELLHSRIKKGTIIIFDEYLNFPDWKNHEYKAFMEFVKSNNIKFEYIAIGTNGMVAVKIN